MGVILAEDKGRSSTPALLQTTRSNCSWEPAAGAGLRHRWVPSERDAADGLSRGRRKAVRLGKELPGPSAPPAVAGSSRRRKRIFEPGVARGERLLAEGRDELRSRVFNVLHPRRRVGEDEADGVLEVWPGLRLGAFDPRSLPKKKPRRAAGERGRKRGGGLPGPQAKVGLGEDLQATRGRAGEPGPKTGSGGADLVPVSPARVEEGSAGCLATSELRAAHRGSQRSAAPGEEYSRAPDPEEVRGAVPSFPDLGGYRPR